MRRNNGHHAITKLPTKGTCKFAIPWVETQYLMVELIGVFALREQETMSKVRFNTYNNQIVLDI